MGDGPTGQTPGPRVFLTGLSGPGRVETAPGPEEVEGVVTVTVVQVRRDGEGVLEGPLLRASVRLPLSSPVLTQGRVVGPLPARRTPSETEGGNKEVPWEE